MDINADEADAAEFVKSFRTDLFDEEVYVFTPKGEVKTLPAGATPIDFAYAVHTDVGHRTVGAKVNGRIVPLHYRLRSGDIVEILTSKSARAVRRATGCRSPPRRAPATRSASGSRASSARTLEPRAASRSSRRSRSRTCRTRRSPAPPCSPQVIRETGFKKAEDFYVALGSGKLHRVEDRQQGDPAAEDRARSPRRSVPLKKPQARETAGSDSYGINVIGVEDVLVRLAKCCTPVPGDAIVGYISLGKGITIHRERLPERAGAAQNPERFTPVEWEGGGQPELPRPDRRRLVGPAAPARGRGPDVRRARREHRLLRRRRRGPARQELVHRRDRRRQGAPRRC